MNLKLRDQQPKTILYTYRWLYQNLMGTTNKKKYNGYTHKKEKQSKHYTKNSQQITREDNIRGREEKRSEITIQNS